MIKTTHVLAIAALLLLLPLLSGCSLRSVLPSTTLVGTTPTPEPTALPTAAPVNGSDTLGYDTRAGNCPDAATQAIAFAGASGAGRYGGTPFSMDMSLDLEPHDPRSGCASAGKILAVYRQEGVYSAHLTVWALDANWQGAQAAIRQQWFSDVLNALRTLYPKAGLQISASAYGAACGSAAGGAGQARQINGDCY